MTLNKKTHQSYKTKHLLRAVLNEMLKKATIEDITIKAIVQEAKITRSTFYTHYQDKYALMEDVIMQNFQEMFDVMEMDYESPPNQLEAQFHSNIKKVLTALYDNKHLFSHMTHQSRTQFILKGVENVHPFVTQQISLLSKLPSINSSYIATFFLNGLFAVYNQWIDDDYNVSIDSLSDQLTYLTMAQFLSLSHSKENIIMVD